MHQQTENILNESLESFMKLCGKESVEVARVLNLLGVNHTRMHNFHESRFLIQGLKALELLLFAAYCCMLDLYRDAKM